MFPIAQALLSLAFVGAPSTTELWYQEVFLGNVAEAAEAYEDVYLRRPRWKNATDEQVHFATLRAGICFEKLSRPDRAGDAYTRLDRPGLSGDELSPRWNRLELRLIPFRERQAERSGLVNDGVVDKHIPDMERRVKAQATELDALRERLQTMGRDLELARKLLTRLESLGVLVTDAATVDSEVWERVADTLAEFLPLFTEFTENPTLDELPELTADALNVAALHAIAARELTTATSLLYTLKAFADEEMVRLDVVSRLLSSPNASSAEALALSRLEHIRLSRIGDLQKKVREALDDARASYGRRGDLSVDDLANLRNWIAWSLPEARHAQEIIDLKREAELLFLVLTAGIKRRDELLHLWNVQDIQVSEAIELSVELVGGAAEMLSLNAKVIAPSGPSSDERLEVFLDGILAESARVSGLGDGVLGARGIERSASMLDQAELLVLWRGKLDPRGAYALAIKVAREGLEVQKTKDGGR